MRYWAFGFLAILLTGCTTVARTGYEAATDERSLATQKAETQLALTIKKNLVDADVKGTGGLDVFCRNGVVVLAGVVPQGSAAGPAAVAIARRVDGVKRVETYFIPDQESTVSDFNIKKKIKARLVVDGGLIVGQGEYSGVQGVGVMVDGVF